MTTIDAPLLPDLLGTSPADLIDQYAPEADPSTPDEARERAERVRAGLLSYFEMRQDIADAFARQDWKALDYGSWFEYVEAEFGAVLTGLSRDERREAARDLQAQGMSTRQIAAATNVSQKQARRDLGQVSPSDVKPRVSPKDSPDPNGSPTADGPAGPGLAYHRVYGTPDRPIDVVAEVRTGDTVLVPHGYPGPRRRLGIRGPRTGRAPSPPSPRIRSCGPRTGRATGALKNARPTRPRCAGSRTSSPPSAPRRTS